MGKFCKLHLQEINVFSNPHNRNTCASLLCGIWGHKVASFTHLGVGDVGSEGQVTTTTWLLAKQR